MDVNDLDKVNLKNSALNSAVVDYIEDNKQVLFEAPFMCEEIFGSSESDSENSNDYDFIEYEYDLVPIFESGIADDTNSLIEAFDLLLSKKENIEKEIRIMIFDICENEVAYTANITSRYYSNDTFLKKVTQKFEIPKS